MGSLDFLLPDLRVVGLFDAGVPNSERIVIRPNRQVSLAGFGLAVGVSAGDVGALPIYDNVFWFPDMLVEPPAWLFLYTGKGTTRQTTLPAGEPALVFHWQRPYVVFGHAELVPVLFRVGYAEVAKRWGPSSGR
jgi:hypothetical protein